jgi:hypothetical protein
LPGRLLLVEDEVPGVMGEPHGVAVGDLDDGVEAGPLSRGEDEQPVLALLEVVGEAFQLGVASLSWR